MDSEASELVEGTSSLTIAAPQIYTPLQSGRNEIRVLRLLAGADPIPIQCTLKVVSLDKTPSYRAISYAWGDPSNTNEIFVNGLSLSVTSNLHSALQHFRKPDGDIHLWADAICVNQDDLLERGQQVQIMRNIYSQSKKTLIWLGPEADDSNKAVDLIKLFGEVVKDCKERSRAMYAMENLDYSMWGPAYSWNVEKELIAFTRLLTRPWWNRVWVVQEMAVSPYLRLFCGAESFSWRELNDAYRFAHASQDGLTHLLHKKGHDVSLLSAGLRNITTLNNISISSKRQDSSLLGMLTRTRKWLASDPRDKCLALAGLADRESLQLLHDRAYIQSVKECYTYVSEIIALSEGTGPLNFLDHAGEPRYQKDLPSWVPDWSYRETGQGRNSFLFYEVRSPSSASFTIKKHSEGGRIVAYDAPGLFRKSHGESASTYQISKETSSLQAKGVIFGSVKATTSRKNILPTETLLGIERADTMRAIYPTGETIVNVFWRTLLADRGWEGEEFPSQWVDLVSMIFLHPEYLEEASDAITRWYQTNKDFQISGYTMEEIVEAHHMANNTLDHAEFILLQKILRTMDRRFHCRELMTTKEGYLALGPKTTQPGDIIAILLGCQVPVVVRKHGDHYEFIGTCYVHGIMHGEALAGLDTGECEAQWFDIR